MSTHIYFIDCIWGGGRSWYRKGSAGLTSKLRFCTWLNTGTEGLTFGEKNNLLKILKLSWKVIVEYFPGRLPCAETFGQHNVRMSVSAEICCVFGQMGESQGEGWCQTGVKPTKQICRLWHVMRLALSVATTQSAGIIGRIKKKHRIQYKMHWISALIRNCPSSPST